MTASNTITILTTPKVVFPAQISPQTSASYTTSPINNISNSNSLFLLAHYPSPYYCPNLLDSPESSLSQWKAISFFQLLWLKTLRSSLVFLHLQNASNHILCNYVVQASIMSCLNYLNNFPTGLIASALEPLQHIFQAEAMRDLLKCKPDLSKPQWLPKSLKIKSQSSPRSYMT